MPQAVQVRYGKLSTDDRALALDAGLVSHGSHLRFERESAAAGGVFPQCYHHQPVPIATQFGGGKGTEFFDQGTRQGYATADCSELDGLLHCWHTICNTEIAHRSRWVFLASWYGCAT